MYFIQTDYWRKLAKLIYLISTFNSQCSISEYERCGDCIDCFWRVTRSVGSTSNDLSKFPTGAPHPPPPRLAKRRTKTMLRDIYIHLYGSGINSGHYSAELWGVKCWMRLVLREAHQIFFLRRVFAVSPRSRWNSIPFGFSITVLERVIFRCKQERCLENWKSFNFSVDWIR